MKSIERSFKCLHSALRISPLASALSLSPMLIGPIWASRAYMLFVPYSVYRALWWWPKGVIYWKLLWWVGYATSGVLPALLALWLTGFLTKKPRAGRSLGLLAWMSVATALTAVLAVYIACQQLPTDIGFLEYWQQYYFYRNPVSASFCVAAAMTFFAAGGGVFQIANNLSGPSRNDRSRFE